MHIHVLVIIISRILFPYGKTDKGRLCVLCPKNKKVNIYMILARIIKKNLNTV